MLFICRAILPRASIDISPLALQELIDSTSESHALPPKHARMDKGTKAEPKESLPGTRSPGSSASPVSKGDGKGLSVGNSPLHTKIPITQSKKRKRVVASPVHEPVDEGTKADPREGLPGTTSSPPFTKGDEKGLGANMSIRQSKKRKRIFPSPVHEPIQSSEYTNFTSTSSQASAATLKQAKSKLKLFHGGSTQKKHTASPK